LSKIIVNKKIKTLAINKLNFKIWWFEIGTLPSFFISAFHYYYWYFFTLLSKITVNKKLNHWLSLNQSLKFEGLKKHSPFSFLFPHFIAIIDIFHIISKNILDNSDFLYNFKKYFGQYWLMVILFVFYFLESNIISG